MPTKKRNGNYTLGKKALFDVTLPSGQTCQARRPGVQGFIAAGVLDSFDQLTALVQTEHVDKKSVRPPSAGGKVTQEEQFDAARAMLADKGKMETGFQLIDKLVVYVVTQPLVWIDYKLIDESDEDFAKREAKAEENEAVGITDIDLEDRLFLMQWAVGGSADLEAFREGLQGNVAAMAAMQAVQSPAE